MSCLSASVVSHFKEKIGDFYLYPAGASGLCEEYTYTVYIPESELENGDTFSWADSDGERGAKIHLRVEDYGGDTLFDGCVDQLSVQWDAPSVEYDSDIEEVVRQSNFNYEAFRLAIEDMRDRLGGGGEEE